MTITKQEAADALGEVERARGDMFRITLYATTAPHLMIWGAAWLIADSLTQYVQRFELVWPVTSAVFGVASFVVSLRTRASAPSGAAGWRPAATFLAVLVFLGCLFSVLWPLSGKQIHSFFGLFLALAYAILGVWFGRRLLFLGAVLAGLTMFGYFRLDAWYPLFMGLVGGGGLILGGLWLRKV